MPRRLNTPEEKRTKTRAGRKVNALVKAGAMPPALKCEACGRRKGDSWAIVYHHWRGYTTDDGADTDCVALCTPCHVDTHVGNLPEVRTGRVREDINELARVTPHLLLDVARARRRGKAWVRHVPGSMFDRLVCEVRAIGLGSLNAGEARLAETVGIAKAKRAIVQGSRANAADRFERECREAMAWARAVVECGNTRRARRALGHEVPRHIRSLAIERGYLAPRVVDLGGEPVTTINRPRRRA